MKIRLTIAQVTAVIDRLEALQASSTPIGDAVIVKDPIANAAALEQEAALKESIIILKTALQEELESTQLRLDSVIKELGDHGYTEITEDFDKVKENIRLQSTKVEDKYFDEFGNIKRNDLLSK